MTAAELRAIRDELVEIQCWAYDRLEGLLERIDVRLEQETTGEAS